MVEDFVVNFELSLNVNAQFIKLLVFLLKRPRPQLRQVGITLSIESV